MTALVLITMGATLTAVAAFVLVTLTDDPPHHCEGCRCDLPGHHYTARPAQLYDYEQDPAHPTAS